jgi:alpha-methylacyl-CoA racemase
MTERHDSTGCPGDRALEGIRIVSIALNLPGPAALARLVEFGAAAFKIEPPAGDPMAVYSPDYYRELHRGVTVINLNLKSDSGYATLGAQLAAADLFITSQRPDALARLKLDWDTLHARMPRLCQVAIVGHAAPRQNDAGHDLTYLAEAGLVTPPNLPPTLMADLIGAERAASIAFAILRLRDRMEIGSYAEVALEAGAHLLSGPLRFGLTGSAGVVGGAAPGYNVYRTQDGWIALAALEPHFLERVMRGLGLTQADATLFADAFRCRTNSYWQAWALRQDIPLTPLAPGGQRGLLAQRPADE